MDYEKNRRIRKDLIDFLEELSKLGKNINFDKWSKSDCAEWIAWVEKQGEQKPVPKFKVGNWVIGRATNNEPRQISEITDQHYKSTYGGQYGFSFEDEMHLWTIQDAKDGDVLVYRDGQWCFIYKGIVTEDTFKYYALLSEKGITVNDAAFSLLTSCIIPATNEQRDLLFQKMKEAGYEWNAEKKELNKIEQESEERSEEDKEMITAIMCSLDGEKIKRVWGKQKEDVENWLKFLKERYTWKPSDAQMVALDGICSYIRNKADWEISQDMVSDLYKLSEQLKKL